MVGSLLGAGDSGVNRQKKPRPNWKGPRERIIEES